VIIIRDEELWKKAKLLGASEQLNEERYYKVPFEKMEFHQQVRCKVEAERALKIAKRILLKYKELTGVD